MDDVFTSESTPQYVRGSVGNYEAPTGKDSAMGWDRNVGRWARVYRLLFIAGSQSFTSLGNRMMIVLLG